MLDTKNKEQLGVYLAVSKKIIKMLGVCGIFFFFKKIYKKIILQRQNRMSLHIP